MAKTKAQAAQAWELVVGLEVHVELATGSKIFCGCPTAYGAAPNTQCCPVCAGLPGALPVLNEKAVDHAIKAGLATHCEIDPASKFDRKHYFYPDLPKGYQISQNDRPLCKNGWLEIAVEGGPKRVGITRIHLEEDAGKLVHPAGGATLIDLNRSGVPLIEIVTEPAMNGAAEAVAFLKKLRAVMVYAGVSDGKMNEGSLRCDVNLSLRRPGSAALGTRTEVKNLNSFGFVARAIEHEFARQVARLEAGEAVGQETRRFDAATGQTHAMRAKEEAADYRFIPEPDLGPLLVDAAKIERLRAEIPALPDERKADYMARYGLSAYHAEQLVLDRAVADLFEAAAALSAHPKQVAALTLGEVLRLRGAAAGDAADEDAPLPLAPAQLAAVADLAGEGRINSGGAKRLLAELWQRGGDPAALVAELGLEQLGDAAALAEVAARVLAQNPKMVADYAAGKTQALRALMGKAMAETRGRADPALLRQMLEEGLKP